MADICRNHSCSDRSFYRSNSKFRGMALSEARRLRELELENDELKNVVAKQTLDIRILKDMNSRK
jgi:putative transposase